MRTLLYFFAVVGLGNLSVSFGATIYATSLSSEDVQDAVDAASAEDTVILPAGTARWTTGVFKNPFPAGVTIKGAGTSATGGGDQTIIIDDITNGGGLFSGFVSDTGVFRLTGITFRSGNGTGKDNTVGFNGPGTIRIDHCTFDMPSLSNYRVLVINNGLFGVIDNCIFNFTSTNSIYVNNGRRGGGDSAGDYEWSLATEFGGDKYLFIEDNIFNGTTNGTTYDSRIFDGYTGAKVVVRFNDVVQAVLAETHATGHSGDDRGLRAQEVYGNRVTSTLAKDPNFVAVDFGSGTSLVWGNEWDEVYKVIFTFKVTRRNSMTYPQLMTPNGWGYAGPTPRATGTVNVSGTAVTWVSGDQFDTNWPVGTMIHIVGMTAEGVAGQTPVDGPGGGIASVNSATSITLANGGHTGSNLTGATYTIGSAWDGNSTGYLGYPAIDQPGRGQGDLLTGVFPSKVNNTTGTIAWPNQALEPIYIWNNSGANAPGWGSTVYNDDSGGLVVANRDYYPQASGENGPPVEGVYSPFNGTSGVGWGTLANRPTTCTAGVAYWATDQGDWNQSTSNPHGVQMNGADGVLYKATATDTWTLYYEPYTYPHPLREETSSVPAKQRLKKVIQSGILMNRRRR